MAKVHWLGATYQDVPAVSLPDGDGGESTFTDVSDTTAQAADVAQGKQFFDALGVLTQGTASGGGGASSWTKVAETTYQVTHGSTSEANVGTFETGHSEIWDSGKIVYVRIRDTEGPRNGYFFEANSFFFVPPGSMQNSTFAFCSKSVNNSGGFDLYTSGVGVFAKTIYSDGDVLIRKKYLGNNTRTIDSTYKVEVYLLDPAGGISPFA